MSTTYETDMFEPLAIGNWTLKAEVSDDSSNEEDAAAMTGVKVARGSSRHNVERAERDDREDVPAAARRQVPEQGAFSIRDVDNVQTIVLYKCLTSIMQQTDPPAAHRARRRRRRLRLLPIAARPRWCSPASSPPTTSIVSPQIAGQIAQLLVTRATPSRRISWSR